MGSHARAHVRALESDRECGCYVTGYGSVRHLGQYAML